MASTLAPLADGCEEIEGGIRDRSLARDPAVAMDFVLAVVENLFGVNDSRQVVEQHLPRPDGGTENAAKPTGDDPGRTGSG